MSYVFPIIATEGLAFYGAVPVTQPTAAAQAALIDGSTGTAAPTTGVGANAAVNSLQIPLGPMSGLVNAGVWKVSMPSAFKLQSALLRIGQPVTTAAKAATLTTQISGVACTGGVISAAGTYATGATQAATAITALNTGAAGATVEIAVSAVTAFTEGTGWIEVTYIDTDLANAIATQIAQANAVRSALVTLGLIKGS